MLANLSRREADLLIREQVPDLGSIVTRRLGSAAYAVYAAAGHDLPGRQAGRPSREALRRCTWIGFDDDHNYMPGQSWVLELLEGARPALRVNNWLVLQQAVAAGAGIALLPCYLGDADPALRRLGAPLPEVTADQWLLVHRDLRDLPRVRAMMDSLVRLFQEERATLEGAGAPERAVPASSPGATS
jgi:DNA-binding transcriptional LysR family regulator